MSCDLWLNAIADEGEMLSRVVIGEGMDGSGFGSRVSTNDKVAGGRKDRIVLQKG